MAENTIVQAYKMPDVTKDQLTPGFYPADDTLPDPALICGIELEIEQFIPIAASTGFRFEADGSLRNHGMEAISMPTAIRFFQSMLTSFFKQHRITPANYSERCSTHIHVNVQDMTWTQVKVLCLLYQVFERLLFNFVGNNREENIFCVPWYQSGITPQFAERLQKNPDSVARNWVKYSALNLLPIRSQGTVEFRHLHGTCDTALIMTWLRILSQMVVYAKRTKAALVKETILELNTVSNYDAFMVDVFGAETPRLFVGEYRHAVSCGVIDAKLMLMTPKKTKAPAEDYTIADVEQAIAGIDAFVQERQRARVRTRPTPPPREAPQAGNPAAELAQPWPGGLRDDPNVVQRANRVGNWNDVMNVNIQAQAAAAQQIRTEAQRDLEAARQRINADREQW